MHISWLLFKKSGKSNRNRLMLTTAAVAVGMLMIMVFTAGVNALSERQNHTQWRNNFFHNSVTTKEIHGVAPLKVSLVPNGNLDKYQEINMNVVSMYATGSNSPELPGLITPKPGEYYVSQGLKMLMQDHPEYNMGARFGDKEIGVIPDKYVGSPDSLDVIRGMSQAESNSPTVASFYSISANPKNPAGGGVTAIIVLLGATILFTPIIVFLIIATQIGSVQREQRYAALRLIGATKTQVNKAIMTESAAATLVGAVLGTIAFYLVRIPLDQYRFELMRFYPADIKVTFLQYCLLVLLLLGLSIGANWWGMRKVSVSPLGVARKQVRVKKPSILRVFPLAIGLSIFIAMLTVGKNWVRENTQSMAPMLVLMFGVVLVMFGLLLAGPYLTRVFSTLIAKNARRANTLIATKRIESQFKGVFRSVSGVVLALFAGSFYLTAVSGVDAYSQNAVKNNGYSQLKPGTAMISGTKIPANYGNNLKGQDYIESVIPVLTTEKGSAIPCSEMTNYTDLNCGTNTGYGIVDFNSAVVEKPQVSQNITGVGNSDYLVKIKSDADIDKLRSYVASTIPAGHSPADASYVISGTGAQKPVINPLIPELAGLAYVGMAVTLFVAIVSLLVSTIGGFYERKHAFATLRLGGMTLGQMRQTVLIESYIPLFFVSLLSAGIGCWVGYATISGLNNAIKVSLEPSYFAIVIGALVLAGIAIYSTLPMLKNLTEPEQNRTE
ncbi:MAG: FtsX-like permease family protein [Micrococcaceae bacterium]